MNYEDLIEALNDDEQLPTPLYHAVVKGGGNVVDIMRKKVIIFTIYKADHRSIELHNFRYISPVGIDLIMDFFEQGYEEWFKD